MWATSPSAFAPQSAAVRAASSDSRASPAIDLARSAAARIRRADSSQRSETERASAVRSESREPIRPQASAVCRASCAARSIEVRSDSRVPSISPAIDRGALPRLPSDERRASASSAATGASARRTNSPNATSIAAPAAATGHAAAIPAAVASRATASESRSIPTTSATESPSPCTGAKPLKNVPYASEYAKALGRRQSIGSPSRSKNRISSPGFDFSGPFSSASTTYAMPDLAARSGTSVNTNRTGTPAVRHASRSARRRASTDS